MNPQLLEKPASQPAQETDLILHNISWEHFELIDSALEGGQLSLYRLQEGGYDESARSEFLSDLNLDLLVRCAKMPDQYDAAREFRKTIRQA